MQGTINHKHGGQSQYNINRYVWQICGMEITLLQQAATCGPTNESLTFCNINYLFSQYLFLHNFVVASCISHCFPLCPPHHYLSRHHHYSLYTVYWAPSKMVNTMCRGPIRNKWSDLSNTVHCVSIGWPGFAINKIPLTAHLLRTLGSVMYLCCPARLPQTPPRVKD
jgi:hypothetical protein